jgi:hypothetical protein
MGRFTGKGALARLEETTDTGLKNRVRRGGRHHPRQPLMPARLFELLLQRLGGATGPAAQRRGAMVLRARLQAGESPASILDV